MNEDTKKTHTMTIEPDVSVSLLSAVDSGSVVQLDGKFGFCVMSEQGPEGSEAFAFYDDARSQFVHRHFNGQPPTVMTVRSEIVIIPALDSLITRHRVTENSRAELLISESGPKIALHLDRGYRLLNLSTGIYSNILGPVAGVFTMWAVCTRTQSGKLIPLIKIPRQHARSSADEGPVEPEVW